MRGVYPTASSLRILPLLFSLSFLVPSSSQAIDLLGPAVPAQAALTPPVSLPLSGFGPFLLDSRLEPRVRFWVNIFGRYRSSETLIIDSRFPQLVFSVVDNKGKPGSVASAKRKVTEIIRKLAIKRERAKDAHPFLSKLKPEELKVLEVFERESLLGELSAIAENPQRIRAQAGLRDTLEDALFYSGKYLPRMESLFVRLGLPKEIAYLPFVESGFNKRAVSRVGASGIWQFMPLTGKLFLRVDEAVDERNDPMRAAEAAARLLKQNFEALGSWPLAITAYNHGTSGVAKAVHDASSPEIADIIEKYEGKNFGFASQNFYACFLAALNVAKNSEAYLGALPRARKLEFDEFVMPDFMALEDFVGKMEIDPAVFRELNPALTEEVYGGARYMPVGYTVRVPEEARANFLQRYEAIPAELKFKSQREDGAGVTAVEPGAGG